MIKSTRSQLVKYFLLTFGWSWLINFPRVLVYFDILSIPPVLFTIMGYLSVFGPMIAAFLLTWNHSKREGVKLLWKSGWSTKFPKKWLIPTLLLMPLMGLLTFLILKLLNHPIQWKNGLPPAMIVPIGLLIYLLGALPEEYGWRGYALPRLQTQFSPLAASLILGVIWALWHLPLHFIEGTTQFNIPILEYFAQTVLLSVIYTWLFNGTRRVFVPILFHAIGNITAAAFPYWVTTTGRWVSFIILLIAAILIVVVKSTNFHKNRVTRLEG